MFEILLGHLVGDYLLQNKWMAGNKNSDSFKCMVHCVIYSLSVCLFTWHWSDGWFSWVFASHFLIDRWSLADKWLRLINGRSITRFVDDGEGIVPGWDKMDKPQLLRYIMLRGSFASLVYAVADNTMHLVLMWAGYKFIFS